MIKTMFLKNTPNTQQNLKNYGVFLINFLFSAWICWAVTGASPRIHDILLLWILWNTLWLKPIFFKITSPLILVWILYSPIGIQYGYPSSGMIASILETNTKEASEFLDIKTIVYFIIFIGLSLVVYCLSKNIIATPKQRTFFKYFSIILSILFIVNIFSIKHQRLHWGYSELLAIFPHTMAQYKFYTINKEKIQQLSTLKDDWQVNQFNPRYQDYVLVLGESVSKHYLSAYGYPVDTTPFLKKVNGTQYTQVINPAAYTIKSVPRLLTIPSETGVLYQNNILSLANKLGMETYWLSNQDKMGEHDNEISYIANHANQSYYLSEEAPTTARYDYQLLPKFKEIIQTQSQKPRLIVIHLMGSHARFSRRVDYNKPHFDFEDDYLSAYLSSILQTDELLADIYKTLHTRQKPFSMIYIPDHGLSAMSLKHGLSQFSLQVPLFKMASDDTQKIMNDEIITGFGFVWFLTEWLGIDTKNQTENTFLNDYRLTSLNQVKIFDDTIKPYLSAEPFDGKLLQPKTP